MVQPLEQESKGKETLIKCQHNLRIGIVCSWSQVSAKHIQQVSILRARCEQAYIGAGGGLLASTLLPLGAEDPNSSSSSSVLNRSSSLTSPLVSFFAGPSIGISVSFEEASSLSTSIMVSCTEGSAGASSSTISSIGDIAGEIEWGITTSRHSGRRAMRLNKIEVKVVQLLGDARRARDVTAASADFHQFSSVLIFNMHDSPPQNVYQRGHPRIRFSLTMPEITFRIKAMGSIFRRCQRWPQS